MTLPEQPKVQNTAKSTQGQQLESAPWARILFWSWVLSSGSLVLGGEYRGGVLEQFIQSVGTGFGFLVMSVACAYLLKGGAWVLNHPFKDRDIGGVIYGCVIVLGILFTASNLNWYRHKGQQAVASSTVGGALPPPAQDIESGPLPDGKIIVGVTREPTNGIKEKWLGSPEVAKVMEADLVELTKKRTEQAHHSEGATGPYPGTFKSESWSVSVKNKNFVIVTIDSNGQFQSKFIMGIKDNVFVKIACMRQGPNPVPHSYGACADKMKETFGVSFAP